jgi:hypothetical protein
MIENATAHAPTAMEKRVPILFNELAPQRVYELETFQKKSLRYCTVGTARRWATIAIPPPD